MHCRFTAFFSSKSGMQRSCKVRCPSGVPQESPGCSLETQSQDSSPVLSPAQALHTIPEYLWQFCWRRGSSASQIIPQPLVSLLIRPLCNSQTASLPHQQDCRIELEEKQCDSRFKAEMRDDSLEIALEASLSA